MTNTINQLDRGLTHVIGWKRILLSPTQEASASRSAMGLAFAIQKIQFAHCAVLASAFSLTSLVASRRYPLLGGICTTIGALSAVASKDAFTVCHNTEELLESSVVTRANAAWSNKNFVNAITKDTLFIGPVYGSALEKMLNQIRVK